LPKRLLPGVSCQQRVAETVWRINRKFVI